MPRGFRPDIRVEGGAQLGRMSAQLKAAGNKTVQKNMRKRLRAAVKPVADEIRRDAAEQSRMVAHSITTSFSYTEKSAGVRIAAKRSKMPEGKQGLPGLFEFGNRNVYSRRQKRGKRLATDEVGTRAVRHPVFADKGKPSDEWTWVSQPVRPYFFKNARRYNDQITKAMVDVLNDVEKELRGN